MINKPPLFKCLNIRSPILNPSRGRRFIHRGSTLPLLGVPSITWPGRLKVKRGSGDINEMQVHMVVAPKHLGWHPGVPLNP